MNIPPIIPIGILLAIMLCGNLYPKRTMIVVAVASVIVLLYPLMKLVRAADLCH